MNEFDVKRLALIMAIQAELEGMKVANFYSLLEKSKIIYFKEDFDKKAEELREIAYKHDQML